MTRWFVTAVPAGVLLAVLMVVVVGGAVLVQRAVRAAFPTLNGEEHNDVTRFTYGFIGFVYAFFIGFVVSNLWGQISTADAAVRAEGAAAVQMARDTTVFDETNRTRVRAALIAYERAAIAEWDTADTASSPQADDELAALYATYRGVAPATDVQKAVLTTSMSNLDQISEARTVRLLTARDDTGPPWPLWTVILIASALVVGTVIVYGVERPALHYPMVVVVGIIVAANLFLILELSHPYLGVVSTSPDPLQDAVRILDKP